MCELQDYFKSINPKDNTILVYGAKYKCWNENGYIGIFEWRQDKNVGDSFQMESKNGHIEVGIPNKWELVITKTNNLWEQE
jgi:hypothetical protein